MKFKFLHFLFFIHISISLYAQNKTFIREYYYHAGESDSKITSRHKALNEVRILLLNEIGTYIESWINYKSSENNFKISKDFFRNEINTITAGITETKILEETWDGYVYYVKAKITVNTEDIIKRINQSLEARIQSKETEKLKKLLQESKLKSKEYQEKINQLKNSLKVQKDLVMEKQKELNILKRKLTEAKEKLKQYNLEKEKIKNEVEKILDKINNKTNLAIENVELGMTPEEVIKICGRPRSVDDCSGLNYNYGKVWIMFEGGVVKAIIDARYWERCADVDFYKHKGHFIKR